MDKTMQHAKTRHNTLLIFAKLPEPGRVKTRLSILKDGVFSAEDACELYKCMLLDVVETSLVALKNLSQPDDIYELVVSTAPSKNMEPMEALLKDAFGNLNDLEISVRVISDKGDSFDAHYNDAFEQVWNTGADCILSMGADLPVITTDDIARGFNELHSLYDANREGVVLSPDQELGVNIVGWNKSADFNHTGVFYNLSGLTVLPAYIDKARNSNIDVVWLPPVPDIDTIADLAHNITLIDALSYCAKCNPEKMPSWPHRTANKLNELGCEMIRIPPNNLFDPRDLIDE